MIWKKIVMKSVFMFDSTVSCVTQVPGPESIIPASYDPEAVRAANLSRAEALSAQQREELFVRRASQNQGSDQHIQ